MTDAPRGLADILPAAALETLKEHWIDSAFQIAALARTKTGADSLSELTSLGVTQITDIARRCRAMLSADELRELDRPIDPDSMPLGALKP